MPTVIFKTKAHRLAERRQKRLEENKPKWDKELKHMKKLQEEFLNAKRNN